MRAPQVRRVALNGRFSGEERPTGTQTTAFHLFDALVRAERDVELVVLGDRGHAGVDAWASVPGTRVVHVPFRSWGRARSQAWEQVALSPRAREEGCALVHHPINTGPRRRAGLAHLVTVHDLNVVHHPEWSGRAFGAWLRHVVLPAVRRADHVTTVSDHVLDDVRATLGLPASRTSRVHNGATPLPLPMTLPSRPDGPARVLGVNLWQPHKNLRRLVSAMAVLRAEGLDVQLRLAGRPQANYRDSVDAADVEQPWIEVLGYVSDEDLATEYATADVVCYPSLSEGFGLPVVEAMSCGASVVTSNVTSLPEVAGGAAVLVDPYDVDALAAGLRTALAEDEASRAARRDASRVVAARFTWSAAAQEYLSLYDVLVPRRALVAAR